MTNDLSENELENTIFSASAQLSEEISGSFTAPSASFSTRIHIKNLLLPDGQSIVLQRAWKIWQLK